jgi:hypothetical protein
MWLFLDEETHGIDGIQIYINNKLMYFHRWIATGCKIVTVNYRSSA